MEGNLSSTIHADTRRIIQPFGRHKCDATLWDSTRFTPYDRQPSAGLPARFYATVKLFQGQWRFET